MHIQFIDYARLYNTKTKKKMQSNINKEILLKRNLRHYIVFKSK